MSAARVFSTSQMAARARQRLPRAVFDFIEGGAGSESAVRRNRARFEQIALLPQALLDCSAAHTEVTLFDQRYAAPFGVAPMGFADLVCPAPTGRWPAPPRHGTFPTSSRPLPRRRSRRSPASRATISGSSFIPAPTRRSLRA
ncbi:MAG: hypothetical protein DCF30_05850 [Hyphomicrobiales bacterium]|nr:MAG: hypothetical protein DCF30_05850 [Hyphomicrobiales bacterium]